jgi:hypothetical protein
MIPSISPGNVRGLADKVIGLGKEVVGTLMNDDRIKESGRLQQEAGSERLKAVEEQLKAQAQEGRRQAAEARQRMARRAKEHAS